MVVRAKYLYRPEYFKAQQKKDEGQILLKTSFNQNIYLFFSLSVFVAIIVFITLGEYTRRETLIGLVSPLGGMVKVQANDTGYIEKLFIKEGDKVQALTPLYEIKTERFDDSGIGIKKRVLESIDNQYKIILERMQQEKQKVDFERQALIEDIDRLNSEIMTSQNVVDLSKRELSLTKKLTDKQKSLLKGKYLSELDYQKQQLDLIAKQSQVETYTLNLQRLEREKQNVVKNLSNLTLNLNIALKDLDKQLEAMKQSKMEFLYNGDSQVRSPINGVIASVLAEEGHSVTVGQPLLIIVPESEKAFVELYSPSRSIGFIKVGQNVRLRFDAFPYEKFGVQTGIVTSVSKSAVAPDMIDNRRLINNIGVEGLYKVKVKLSKPTITVYGREENLVSGMTVVGDIELDTRKIYEWILEPLYTIKGKI
ncbi:HlyD family secretion protein [Vibrio jasicida]|uniref:HlyD family secretion protein n=1 Tax=Vibrio jasicida TaxID=766224 RepID=UPI0005ED9BAE|nr:HlyD family efflux transporter periplasmic adaptor subunit [Vibrio jasicida]